MFIIKIFSAALTPLIAVIMGYIAYQQYYVNKSRLRHELYDRRLSVFREVSKFLRSVVSEGKTDYQTLLGFYANSVEALFMFKKEIHEYREDLYNKGMQLIKIHEKLEGEWKLEEGENENKLRKEKQELLNWFFNEAKNSREKFKKYLSVTK